MQICIERIGENAILMQFHTIIPDILSSGELENILTTNLTDFLAVWNYGKLSAKFLVISINVMGTVWFLSCFFSNFTQTTIKIPLKFPAFTVNKPNGWSNLQNF